MLNSEQFFKFYRTRKIGNIFNYAQWKSKSLNLDFFNYNFLNLEIAFLKINHKIQRLMFKSLVIHV